jgi:hypothetical protein
MHAHIPFKYKPFSFLEKLSIYVYTICKHSIYGEEPVRKLVVIQKETVIFKSCLLRQNVAVSSRKWIIKKYIVFILKTKLEISIYRKLNPSKKDKNLAAGLMCNVDKAKNKIISVSRRKC